jgi:hypothetical protein
MSCLGIVTPPPHHLQRLPDKPRARCMHATELQQPALPPLYPRVHARAIEPGRVLAATPCCPIHSWCRTYKRTPPCLAFHPRRRPPVRSGEFAITASVFFVAAIVERSAHTFYLPMRRSQGTPRAQSSFLSHWTPTFTAVELWHCRSH